ncbi:hypothetical protein A3A75_06315 [Candidatus Woesebacteria bacterium RIFCSPLOWO2_01_FULL_39_10]|uniref:Glycosyl transferase n=1 Tax=Candidatus Woesebacteria bacterium RIFCSPLOWO2_01_FULL_39_10 TaxID=1802516 RepID=A0A1F8B557_9BACT|nr:MAG: hypothetical protein A3A75_06315 [Candidatus Woesebacteria bacterium RIFCSPLOWO2_01_FULL_39_10]
MNLPKVLILAPIQHDFPPKGYGPWELISYNLCEELVKMGVEVTVFATKSAKTRAKLLAFWEEPVDEKSIDSDSKNLIHISEAIKVAKDFDIVHNHLNIHPVLFAKLLGVRMVTTLHGAGCERKNKPYHEYLKEENYVSISYAEREFAPYLNYVENVYNGVDFNKYEISEGKGEYLLFSGRITKEKGIEDAIELSKRTGFPLKIAGIITDAEYYRKTVEPNLSPGKIEYLGNLAYTEYVPVLKKAAATLFLISWDEPFGLSIVDSLASGVPAIGYPRGAFPELVFDNRMGIIVNNLDEAADAVKNLTSFNPVEVRNLAFDKFSADKMAKGYLEVYKKLLADKL